MNRAVIVLCLLIANAVINPGKQSPPESAPPARSDSSLGRFAVLDGATLAPPESRGGCTGQHRTDDARTPLFDVRL